MDAAPADVEHLAPALQRELLAFGVPAAAAAPPACPSLAGPALALAVDLAWLPAGSSLMTSAHAITDTPARQRQAETISQHGARTLATARCYLPTCPGQEARKLALLQDEPVAKLQLCSRCMKALYCSPECQRAHWRGEGGAQPHKLECAEAASADEHAVSAAQGAFLDAAAFVRAAAPALAAMFYVWWSRWRSLGLPFMPLLHLQLAPPFGTGGCAWRVAPFLPALYATALRRATPPREAARVEAALAAAGGRDDAAAAAFLDAAGVAEVALLLHTMPAMYERYGSALASGERIFVAITGGPSHDYGLTKWVTLQHCVPLAHLEQRYSALAQRASSGAGGGGAGEAAAAAAAAALLRATHLVAFPVREGEASHAALHAAQRAAQGEFSCDLTLSLQKEPWRGRDSSALEALDKALAEGRRQRMLGVLYGAWEPAGGGGSAAGGGGSGSGAAAGGGGGGGGGGDSSEEGLDAVLPKPTKRKGKGFMPKKKLPGS